MTVYPKGSKNMKDRITSAKPNFGKWILLRVIQTPMMFSRDDIVTGGQR